jgi:hypothetical protein
MVDAIALNSGEEPAENAVRDAIAADPGLTARQRTLCEIDESFVARAWPAVSPARRRAK